MRIAAIGDNCIDFYEGLNRWYPTGNAVDFAVNIRRLGAETSLLSTTGDDAYGREMFRVLQAEGICLSHFFMRPGETAVARMRLDGRERVHLSYAEGVMEDVSFSPEDIAFAAGHDLIHLAFWGHAEAHLPALRENGAVIVFDYANKLQAPLVTQTLPLVDIAFFSSDLSDEDTRAYLRQAQARGPRLAVATRGTQGSIVYDGGQYYSFGIVKTKVVNTVGAGDAYIAGFSHAYMQAQSIPQCMAVGAETAARVIACFGPWEER